MNKKTCVTCEKNLTGLQRMYCCGACKQKPHQNNTYANQQARGKKRKLILIEESGGSCQKCGYNKNYAALAFHHREPSEKSFSLDLRSLSNRSWAVSREEFKKCDLLCSNCHLEHHNPSCQL